MATLDTLPHLTVIILSASVAAPLETGGIHLPAPRPGPPITQQPGAAASPAPKAPQAAAGAQAPGGRGTAGTTTVVSRAYRWSPWPGVSSARLEASGR